MADLRSSNTRTIHARSKWTFSKSIKNWFAINQSGPMSENWFDTNHFEINPHPRVGTNEPRVQKQNTKVSITITAWWMYKIVRVLFWLVWIVAQFFFYIYNTRIQGLSWFMLKNNHCYKPCSLNYKFELLRFDSMVESYYIQKGIRFFFIIE